MTDQPRNCRACAKWSQPLLLVNIGKCARLPIVPKRDPTFSHWSHAEDCCADFKSKVTR